MKPRFPIKVYFHEDGDVWTISDKEDAAYSLEWFDSDDPDENASVSDSNGRLVRIKIRELKVIVCELYEENDQSL